jgi:DNA primase
MVAFSSSDPLKRTPPSEYVEALTGEEVPPSGFIHCPLHADRTPSFRVYDDHWWCFACHTGGGVYELASRLWGLSTRGRDFLELRRRIAAALLERSAL